MNSGILDLYVSCNMSMGEKKQNLCILSKSLLITCLSCSQFKPFSCHHGIYYYTNTSQHPPQLLSWGKPIVSLLLFMVTWLIMIYLNLHLVSFSLILKDNTACNGSCNSSLIMVNSLPLCMLEKKKVKYFAFIFCRYFCWVQKSKFTNVIFHYVKDVIPLCSGLHGSWRQVCCHFFIFLYM